MEEGKKYCKECCREISEEDSRKFEGLCKNCFNIHDTNAGNKKLILILLLIFIVIMLIIFINPIKILVYKNELKNDIKTKVLSNCEFYEKLYFKGKFNNLIHIEMNSEFNNLEYKKQEELIKNITNEIENIYIMYQAKVVQINNKITVDENNRMGVFIHVENDIYRYRAEITKNGATYNEKTSLVEKLAKKINNSNIESKDTLINYLKNMSDIDSLKNISNIDNMDECKNEIIYLSAINLYKNGHFKDAISRFNKLESDYKEKNTYLKNAETLDKLQGTYRSNYIRLMVINEWNITFGVDPKYNTAYNFDEYTFNYKIENDEIILTRERTIREIANDICERYKIDINNKTLSGGEHYTYYYESSNVNFPKKLKQPSIGMTKSEAENSTWGMPNKINKTTTAYGTREQWVYGNGKYLYFENGILTSIQN